MGEKIIMRLKLSVPNLKRIFSMGESGVFFSLIVMCTALTFLSPYFLSVNNLLNIVRQISVIGIISAGMTFAIIVGGIDLSVGSMMAFTGCLMALLVPIQAICMVIVLIILHFLLSRMSFGYKVYAVGGNERAAFISGINVKNTKLIVFALSGFLCAIAALLSVTYIGAIEPMIGIGYELDAISAAVIGGTDLSGGSGTILGTFLGACIMGVLYNGLVLLGVSPFMTQTIVGLVVIVAVTIGLILKKRR